MHELHFTPFKGVKCSSKMWFWFIQFDTVYLLILHCYYVVTHELNPFGKWTPKCNHSASRSHFAWFHFVYLWNKMISFSAATEREVFLLRSHEPFDSDAFRVGVQTPELIPFMHSFFFLKPFLTSCCRNKKSLCVNSAASSSSSSPFH